MSPPPTVTDRTGRSVPLQRLLGEGGEGLVFTLSADTGQVAKIYKQGKLPPPEKLAALVGLASKPLLAIAAWPTSLLFHPSTRKLAGILMPRLTDYQSVQHLYNPVQRLKFFPRAGWDFQVRAARNLAAAFDEVHRAGCIIGDVNQGNALVNNQALVRLIDCDSFQFRVNGQHWPCDVGVAHYIPPELQGKTLRGVIRTENHDRFGLAVLLYQLLFVGSHPYMGLYRGPGDPSFDDLIKGFRFAQGPLARTWGMEPPPHTPVFSDIPPDLGILFRRAFERGSDAGTRPKPAEWILRLKGLEQNLAECPADPGHKFWRGAGTCVWCRLANNGGPEYFFGVSGDVGAFSVDNTRLQEVLRRLSACSLIEFPTDRKTFLRPEPPPPRALPADVVPPHDGGIFQALGRWVASLFVTSLWDEELRRRKRAYNEALEGLKQVESKWRERIHEYRERHSGLVKLIHRFVSECRELSAEYQDEFKRLTANAEAMARVRHLQLHLIADAEIDRIGVGRKALLAQFRIYSAADVEEYRVRSIKGFGPLLTANLIAWKAEVLRQFRFDAATAIAAIDQRSLTVKFRTRQQQCLNQADRHFAELEQLAPACRKALEAMYPELSRRLVAWGQARADLRVMKSTR
jgi:DNA-binding helix-hairpin-helix protein with protein kinase domain